VTARRSLWLTSLVACCLLPLIAAWTVAEVPKKINYQGRITDSATAEPLPGPHEMVFRVYDVEFGGTALWSESHTVETDSAGVFSVVIGSVFPIDLVLGEPMWLEVEVDGEVLTPRRELTSVPYAFYAAHAVRASEAAHASNADSLAGLAVDAFGDGYSLDAADGDPVDVVYVAADGNVGIGTTTPARQLDVAGDVRLDNDRGISFGDDNTRLFQSGMDLYARAGDDIHLRPSGNLYIGAGTSNHFVFDNTKQRLGIGTTSPAEALDIVGNARIAGFGGSPLMLSATGYSYIDFANPGPGPMGLRLQNSHGTMFMAHGAGSENRFGIINASPTKEVLSIDWDTNNVGIWTTEPDTGTVVTLDAFGRSYGLKVTGGRVFSICGSYTGNYPGAAIAARTESAEGSALEAIATQGFAAVEARGDDGVQYAVYAEANGADYAGYFDGRVRIDETSDDLVIPLTVRDNAYSNGQQTVSIELTDAPAGGHDMLQLKSSLNSPTDFQFIECEIPTPAIDYKFRVWGDGHVTADGDYSSGGADLAEMMGVSSGASTVEAGDVLVIDPEGSRSVAKSSKARSTLVAGIYSTKPGFVGAEREWDKPGGPGEEESGGYTLVDMASEFDEVPMAVVGIVPCKVSAENGPVRPGDLLVTSDTPGHAMRDGDPGVGTVLGKALEALDSGTGTIRVLVTLQ
jgi:hypothetical protein